MVYGFQENYGSIRDKVLYLVEMMHGENTNFGFNFLPDYETFIYEVDKAFEGLIGSQNMFDTSKLEKLTKARIISRYNDSLI